MVFIYRALKIATETLWEDEMFWCKHDWKLMTETTTKSKYEVATESVATEFLAGCTEMKLPWQLCDAERKHIQVFSCIHCGKMKRFVENI